LNDEIIMNNPIWLVFETLLKITKHDSPHMLIDACSNREFNVAPIIKILLEYGKDPNESTDITNQTAFLCACCNHRITVDTIKLMIDAGANVNELNIDKDTPLLGVVGTVYYKHHTDTKKKIELLLDHGANINYYNHKHRYSAIINICQYRWDESINDIIKMLLDRGADCNIIGIDDKSGFIYHLIQGNIESVKYFIEHGAHVTKNELMNYVYYYDCYGINYIPYYVYIYLLNKLNYSNEDELTGVKAWTSIYKNTLEDNRRKYIRIYSENDGLK